MSYHSFLSDTGEEYGSFEIFEAWQMNDDLPNGFYWHACFPGCMPDGEPNGPFETEEQALQNAQDY